MSRPDFFLPGDHKLVLEWLRDDGNRVYSTTKFDNLEFSSGIGRQQKDNPRRESIGRIATHATFLHHDWSSLLSIIAKLDWMSALVETDNSKTTRVERARRRIHWLACKAIGAVPRRHLPDSYWTEFARIDLETFFVEFRSAFDHLALIIARTSTRAGQVPEDSYNSLIKWCNEPNGRANAALDPRIMSRIIASEWWFSEIREFRDNNLHFGGQNIVFPTPGDICFSTVRGSQVFCRPELMYNQNLVSFSRLAGYTLVAFWRLAEAVSEVAFERFSLPTVGIGGVQSYHLGKLVLRKWVEQSIASAGDPVGTHDAGV